MDKNQEKMNEILLAVNNAVYAHYNCFLGDLEEMILAASLKGWTYEEIAEDLGYSHKYISQGIGYKLMRKLSKALGEPVRKKQIHGPIRRLLVATRNDKRFDPQ